VRLFSADPGKITGWFMIDFATGSWTGGELEHDTFLDWMEPQPHQYTNSPLMLWSVDRVLVENFKIGPRTFQTNPTAAELWSVKQIGALEMWCRRLDIPISLQMPSAMLFDKDGSKLKRLDWWAPKVVVKGEAGHRRAAAKHALKFGIDHNLIDLEKLT
jgi:hypothetical protein